MRNKFLLFYFLFVVLCLFSCRKEDVTNTSEKVKVNIRFTGLGSDGRGIGNVSSIKKAVSYYKLDDNYSIEVKQKEVIDNLQVSEFGKMSSVASTSVPVRNGVSVRILAFDKETDLLASEIVYVVGEDENPELELLAGREYIFVAVSLNTLSTFDIQLNSWLSFRPSVSYLDVNIPALSGAIIENLVISDLNQTFEEEDFLPFNCPLYFFRKDDLGVITAGNNNLNIALRQLHSEVTFNINEDQSPYDEEIVLEARFESDYTYFSTNRTPFSMINGSLIHTYREQPDIDFSLFKSIDDKYVFHMIEEDLNAKCLIKLKNTKINGVSTDRFIPLDNVILRNGLKYSINVKILPNSEVPVDVELLNLHYYDYGSEEGYLFY